MWGHSIQIDNHRNNVLLLYHIPWGLYNADYSYSGIHLQIHLEGNLVENIEIIRMFQVTQMTKWWLSDDWKVIGKSNFSRISFTIQ